MTSKDQKRSVLIGADSSVAKLSPIQVSSLLSFGFSGGADSSAAPALQSKLSSLDQQTIQQVISDLQSKIVEEGPLSLPRLTSAEASTYRPVVGRTLVNALTSEDVGYEALEVLAKFGLVLMGDDFPTATRCTGLIVYAVASSALYTRHGVPLKVESEILQVVFDFLDKNPEFRPFHSG